MESGSRDGQTLRLAQGFGFLQNWCYFKLDAPVRKTLASIVGLFSFRPNVWKLPKRGYQIQRNTDLVIWLRRNLNDILENWMTLASIDIDLQSSSSKWYNTYHLTTKSVNMCKDNLLLSDFWVSPLLLAEVNMSENILYWIRIGGRCAGWKI